MAQGAVKSKSKAKPSSTSSQTPRRITKKGSRFIAPKKVTLAKQQKASKKLSAGLIAKTEKMLGERAGHLELLTGGKKERKKNDAHGMSKKKDLASQPVRKKSS